MTDTELEALLAAAFDSKAQAAIPHQTTVPEFVADVVGSVGRTRRPGRPNWIAPLLAAAAVIAVVLVAVQTMRHADDQRSAGGLSTQVIDNFTPYDASGILRVPVTSTRSGVCADGYAQSDAYRCSDFVHYSPCFANPLIARPTSVACVYGPWDPVRADIVTLTSPLPKPALAPRVWAFELDNGMPCAGGNTEDMPTIFGARAQYGCGPQPDSGMFAGALDTSTRLWTVALHEPGRPDVRVGVTRAWTLGPFH